MQQREFNRKNFRASQREIFQLKTQRKHKPHRSNYHRESPSTFDAPSKICEALRGEKLLNVCYLVEAWVLEALWFWEKLSCRLLTCSRWWDCDSLSGAWRQPHECEKVNHDAWEFSQLPSLVSDALFIADRVWIHCSRNLQVAGAPVRVCLVALDKD